MSALPGASFVLDMQRECGHALAVIQGAAAFNGAEQTAVKSTNQWMNGLTGTGGKSFRQMLAP